MDPNSQSDTQRGTQKAPVGAGNEAMTLADSSNIPSFISNAPWYTSATPMEKDSNIRKRRVDEEQISVEGMKHQRTNPETTMVANNEPKRGTGIKDAFEKVQTQRFEAAQEHRVGDVEAERKAKAKAKRKAREWRRKGRCELCGGSHSKIECLQTSSTTYVRHQSEDYDAKRDAWYGYDNAKDYESVVEGLQRKEREAIEEYKKAHEGESKTTGDGPTIGSTESPIDTSTLIEAVLVRSKLRATEAYTGRSLDEKPRYLEVIKTGEELRYNPKSRIYKDLKEGYLNDKGQFVAHLTGEAAEFEKLKKFSRSVQNAREEQAEEDGGAAADVRYNTEVNPTEAARLLKEKEDKDKIVREEKERQLREMYG